MIFTVEIYYSTLEVKTDDKKKWSKNELNNIILYSKYLFNYKTTAK